MPGYHAVMATFVAITGNDSVFSLRAATLIFGFLTIMMFFMILNNTASQFKYLRTLQFATLPLVFVFFYLIYTDILSLLFILVMIYFSNRKQYILAGIFGICSMLIRQNNIIWISIVPFMYFLDHWNIQGVSDLIKETIKKMWVFILALFLFILFIIVNDGVAVGDASSHPAFKFSTGNLFFFLFCVFVFFLPFQIYYLKEVFVFVYKNRIVWVASFLIFLVYWYTFNPDHPYNALAPHYFLRNLILTKITQSDFFKLLFFMPVLYSVWLLYLMPLRNKVYYLLYPLTVLFLTPSWLIEQRYYIIPVVLFLIFRKPLSKPVEIIQFCYNIILLALLMPLILAGKAFL